MEKRTNAGGMALLEGVMMIGPDKKAVAVRKPDGEIEVTSEKLKYSSKIRKIPFLRGVNGLFNQMVHGMKAMMHAAEYFDIEEEPGNTSKFEKWLQKVLGDKMKSAVIYFSVVVGILFSVGLFILLPNLLVRVFGIESSLINNLIEGGFRILLFFGYVVLISKMNDIKRVWMYHGAEHMTINCYENGEELTMENVKKYTTRHKRCGTSFMFVVIVISIFVFALTGWHSAIINMVVRILLIPVVAGMAYELIRLAWKKDNWFSKTLSAPGLLFQSFTAREPDDGMLEVAIAALKEAVPSAADEQTDENQRTD
ncbi:MAG: DUF1385 domain-containing protein [Clostridia bacterium]